MPRISPTYFPVVRRAAQGANRETGKRQADQEEPQAKKSALTLS